MPESHQKHSSTTFTNRSSHLYQVLIISVYPHIAKHISTYAYLCACCAGLHGTAGPQAKCPGAQPDKRKEEEE